MIRRAKKSDLAKIKALIDVAAASSHILPRTRAEIAKVLPCFYVCDRRGDIIGCCSLEIYNKKLAEIRSLVIAPGYQGRGWGSKLVAACVRQAKRKKIYEVLAVTDQENLFARQGFVKQLANQWPMFLRPTSSAKIQI